jgi:hypothetical protein
MNQPVCARSLRRLGCFVAALAAGMIANRAVAEPPLLPDLPPAAPLPPAPMPAGPSPVEAGKLIDAEVGMRLGARVQNQDKPAKLDDGAMDGRVEVQLSGAINSALKWQAAFIGILGVSDRDGQTETRRAELDGKAAVLEIIGRLELHDAFKLWVGRMLVPADRAGLSTEWSMAPWLFPGQFTFARPPVGARQGTFGRSDGATLWGDLFGGMLKYYVGIYNLGDPDLAPLYSGRLSLSLLDPEPGYRISSSTYGSKDLLTVGVGLQHQIDGSTHAVSTTPEQVDGWDDFTELNVDLLFEKNLGIAGVLDVEGAFYKIWGKYEPETWTSFVLVSYLLPIEVGWGRFQPLFRLQRASQRGKDGSDTLADAQLGYIMDGARARVILDYQYSKVSSQSGNALLFGLQLMSR